MFSLSPFSLVSLPLSFCQFSAFGKRRLKANIFFSMNTKLKTGTQALYEIPSHLLVHFGSLVPLVRFSLYFSIFRCRSFQVQKMAEQSEVEQDGAHLPHRPQPGRSRSADVQLAVPPLPAAGKPTFLRHHASCPQV